MDFPVNELTSKVIGLVENIRKESKEKTVTNAQYLNLMNFFGSGDVEKRRIKAICEKFGIKFVIALPRSKYKEALQFMNNFIMEESIKESEKKLTNKK